MTAEYYHFCAHIYASRFRDELILLDTKRDTYTICSEPFSVLLLGLVGEPNSKGSFSSCSDKQFSNHETDDIQALINDAIIKKKETPYSYFIDQKIDSHGVSNVDWSLSLEDKKVKMNESVWKALMTLIKVNFYTQIRGFYKTIRLIKKSRKSQSDYILPQREELESLAKIVNKACLIYPTKTKCLEWAITFVLLALKRKWKCNLEIGVQNYPFLAHAWVECDGKVVMDSQDLREGLAIILSEPFRRLKI